MCRNKIKANRSLTLSVLRLECPSFHRNRIFLTKLCKRAHPKRSFSICFCLDICSLQRWIGWTQWTYTLATLLHWNHPCHHIFPRVAPKTNRPHSKREIIRTCTVLGEYTYGAAFLQVTVLLKFRSEHGRTFNHRLNILLANNGGNRGKGILMWRTLYYQFSIRFIIITLHLLY